jgi:FkbM family methyltransferase
MYPPLAHPVPPSVSETDPGFAAHYKPEDHWFSASGIETVLDVGAHKGEFAQRIREMLPQAELVCFEPLEEPFSQLKRRFEGQPRFRAIRCALGQEAGRQTIHLNEYAPSSSLLPMSDLHRRSFSFAVNERAEEIEVRRLTDVAKELGLQGPLLIKLDVQGFEDKVIAGGADVIALAKAMIVEVSFEPLYEGGPLFDDIYNILKAHGFYYSGNFDQLLSPVDGRVLQADAIFARRVVPPDRR